MSRTKLLLDLLEDVQAMSDSLRALTEALAADDNLESTASPPKKAKAPSKKEIATEPIVEQAPEYVETPEEVPPTKTITFEELRGAMATKSQKGKKSEVKALLTKYGVEKLSEIPVESYQELMAEVEAL